MNNNNYYDMGAGSDSYPGMGLKDLLDAWYRNTWAHSQGLDDDPLGGPAPWKGMPTTVQDISKPLKQFPHPGIRALMWTGPFRDDIWKRYKQWADDYSQTNPYNEPEGYWR